MNYQRLYDRMSTIYVPLVRLFPMWQHYIQPALPWLDQKPSVLEIGPGPGLLHEQIARSHVFTAGVDLSAGMLRQTQRRLRRQALTPRLVQANAIQLPFEDEAFDGLVLTFVFSAIPAGAAALREMYRVLRPTGVVVLIDACVPSNGNVAARRLGRLWALFGDQLRDEAALMRTVGFHIIECKEYGAFHSIRLTVAGK